MLSKQNNHTKNDRYSRIAKQWDVSATPPFLNKKRIGFDEFWFSFLQQIRQRDLDRLPKMRSVFEFGCGSGENLAYLLKSGKVEEAAGIDISTGAVSGARALVKHFGLERQCKIHCGNLEDYQPTQSWDIVLCLQVVNYVEKLETILELIKRMTRRGSFVLIHDGQRSSSPLIDKLVRNKSLRRLLSKGPFPAEETFCHSPEEVEKIATQYGFELVQKEMSMPSFVGLANVLLRPLLLSEFKHRITRCAAKSFYQISVRFLELVARLIRCKPEKHILYSLYFKKT